MTAIIITKPPASWLAHNEPQPETEARDWIRSVLQPSDSLLHAAGVCLIAWQALTAKTPFAG